MPRADRPEADLLSQQFANILRSELHRQGMSQSDLARRLGVGRPNTNAVLNQPGNVKSATVVSYLAALGFEPELRAVPIGTLAVSAPTVTTTGFVPE